MEDIDIAEYKKSLSELYEILKHLPIEARNKIPDEELKFYESNRDLNYQYIYDTSLSVNEQKLMDITIMLIANIYVNYWAENEGIKVTGVIGNTTIARDNRKSQILYLNKRNIKNQILTNSADQAFKGATGIGKYGFFILNLEMPANYYDVNVHPTKMEVRFNDEDKLYKVFYHAIKSAMLNSEFLDNNEKEQKKENYIENEL